MTELMPHEGLNFRVEPRNHTATTCASPSLAFVGLRVVEDKLIARFALPTLPARELP